MVIISRDQLRIILFILGKKFNLFKLEKIQSLFKQTFIVISKITEISIENCYMIMKTEFSKWPPKEIVSHMKISKMDITNANGY